MEEKDNKQSKKKSLELLVVEDMPDNIAAAKAYFQGIEGVNVEYASSFEEAKEKLQSNVYAAAIIDLHIPKAQGEMAEKLGHLLAAEAEVYAVNYLLFSAVYQIGKSFVSMQPGSQFGLLEPASATKSESKADPKAWEEAFEKLQKVFPNMGMVQAAKMKYKHAVGMPYKVQIKPEWAR